MMHGQQNVKFRLQLVLAPSHDFAIEYLPAVYILCRTGVVITLTKDILKSVIRIVQDFTFSKGVDEVSSRLGYYTVSTGIERRFGGNTLP
jgi:hypothetical protein